jgi:hypothetical protein
LNSLAGVNNYSIDGQSKELAFIFATLYNASSNLTSKPALSVKITQLTDKGTAVLVFSDEMFTPPPKIIQNATFYNSSIKTY